MLFNQFPSVASLIRIAGSLSICGLGLLLTGCFGNLAHRLADRETYQIIGEKQEEALGARQPFTIEPDQSDLTRSIYAEAGRSADPFTTTGLVLSLSDTLALAIDNNEDYQTAKEDLYLTALELTEERHQFSPIFTGLISARMNRVPATESRVITEQVEVTDPVTGMPTVVTRTRTEERTIAERFGEMQTSLAVTKLFATGARLTVGLTNNFLRFYTGDKRHVDTGALSASIVQPLLQGAGTDVNLENLRQAERNVIYAVRDFSRFEKSFLIDRIDDYFRLLQAYDQIDNEWRAYQRLTVLRRRAELFEEADRMAPFEVDQARQDEIRARNRWLTARTDYGILLDQFKVDLGLPPELTILPDERELEALRNAGLVELQYGLEEAQQVAVARRLDLMTAQALAEDAARRLKVAENNLLPVLDARFDYVIRDSGENHPFDLTNELREYGAGLDLELPLDRKVQRNDYRRAVITRALRERQADRLRNQVIAEVRRTYQQAVQAAQSYEIQLASRELAAKRVQSVDMLLDLGREGVSIRDRLEAEDALRNAENELTRELVNYLIARLEFYNAIEALEVDERGAWHEMAPDTTTRNLDHERLSNG